MLTRAMTRQAASELPRRARQLVERDHRCRECCSPADSQIAQHTKARGARGPTLVWKRPRRRPVFRARTETPQRGALRGRSRRRLVGEELRQARRQGVVSSPRWGLGLRPTGPGEPRPRGQRMQTAARPSAPRGGQPQRPVASAPMELRPGPPDIVHSCAQQWRARLRSLRRPRRCWAPRGGARTRASTASWSSGRRGRWCRTAPSRRAWCSVSHAPVIGHPRCQSHRLDRNHQPRNPPWSHQESTRQRHRRAGAQGPAASGWRGQSDSACMRAGCCAQWPRKCADCGTVGRHVGSLPGMSAGLQ
eukprot:m.61109 g.61109  ORF g.61109 m.61109 type:complete len:305 (-) comp7061_c0_seq1:1169-2083(-)